MSGSEPITSDSRWPEMNTSEMSASEMGTPGMSEQNVAPADVRDANALLAEIAGIGCDEVRGGYSRPVFGPAELRLRDWFAGHAKALGLDVHTDSNGVIWAWWDTGDRADAVVTGSHLDSVPGGGNFDGPLGVASGLAAVARLQEAGFRPARPIAVTVWPEEEGSRFGLACLGSRLATGAADPDTVRALSDDSGASFARAAAESGVLDPATIGPDLAALARIGAFVELHVEQGRGLADLDQPVALGGAILAHGRWHVTLTGTGDHAGSTRMADRHDPVFVAAGLIRAVRCQAAAVPEARATVGRLQVTPGGTNVIASRVDAWLDVRHRDDATVRGIVSAIEAAAGQAARAEGCTVTVAEESFSPAVDFDAGLRARLQSVLPDAPVLDTGAGHDAGVLAAAVPTAMLFVRNPTGTSHAPAESARPVDVEAGVAALTRVLTALAG